MKKRKIDIEKWNRKEHFKFFSGFDEPFFGMTVNVDCTIAYANAKKHNISFFLYYLYRTLKAANEVENFRYRIIDGEVCDFSRVSGSPTINRPDGTFGFAYINYEEDENLFYKKAIEEIEQVKKSKNLLPAVSGENVIHLSTIPWIKFTSLSHARNFAFPDSCPKITFGKIDKQNDIKEMPVSIHVHHGLMDAYHVHLFIQRFQELLNEM